MSTPEMNELWIDLENPPQGVVVDDGGVYIDDRLWRNHITAVHEYERGHRVTLTINNVVLEFHRDFNPAFEESFVTAGAPMNWVAQVTDTHLGAMKVFWEERNG